MLKLKKIKTKFPKIKIPAKLKAVFTKKRIIIFVATIVVLAGLWFGKSLVVAAWVNKTPVFRFTLTHELEKQGGSQVLSNLIDKSLVQQEAKKQNITVTQAEVDTDISSIEDTLKTQGMTLDQALSFRGQNKTDLIDQIKFQKTVEKLLTSKITITDTEIADYFQKNKTTFPTGSTLNTVKTQIHDSIFQQKLSDQYTAWISDLRTKAKIIYFVNF